MKKISKLLPILLAITILFTACGDKKKIDAKSNADSKKVEIKNNKDKKKDKKEDKEKTTAEKESTTKGKKAATNTNKKSRNTKTNNKSSNNSNFNGDEINSKEVPKVLKIIDQFYIAARADDEQGMSKVVYYLNYDEFYSSPDDDTNGSDDSEDEDFDDVDLEAISMLDKFYQEKYAKLTYTAHVKMVDGAAALVDVKCTYIDLNAFMVNFENAVIQELDRLDANGETDINVSAVCKQVLQQKISSYKDTYKTSTYELSMLNHATKGWVIENLPVQTRKSITCNLYTYYKS